MMESCFHAFDLWLPLVPLRLGGPVVTHKRSHINPTAHFMMNHALTESRSTHVIECMMQVIRSSSPRVVRPLEAATSRG